MRKDTEDYIGTCPCCFGEYKVKTRGGKSWMVNHGFRRPGDGYQHGGCPGVDEVPFEHSPEGTKRHIKDMQAEKQRIEEWRRKLQKGEVNKLLVGRYDYTLPRGQQRMSVEIGPDDSEFQDEVDRRIFLAGKDIRWFESVIVFLQGKVDSWERKPIVGVDVPATGRMRQLKDAYDPDRPEPKPRVEKPGKIRLSVYFLHPYADSRDEYREWCENLDKLLADLAARAKAYVAEEFGGERLRVQKTVHEHPVYHALLDDGEKPGLKAIEGVTVTGLDWEVRERVMELQPRDRLVDHETKKDITVILSLDEFEALEQPNNAPR